MYIYMFNIIVKIPSNNKKKHPQKNERENIHKIRPRGSDFQGREPHAQLGLRMGRFCPLGLISIHLTLPL